jgi:hypothetical protein
MYDPKVAMDKSEPAVIGRAWTESEASVIKSLLESYNIPCHYTSELVHRLYPVSPDNPGPIRIFVPAALAEEAKYILDEHCRSQPPLRPPED